MFPELRAVQIEVPGDVLEMREGSGEAPAHEAGALLHHLSSSRGCPSNRTAVPRLHSNSLVVHRMFLLDQTD